MAGVTTDLPDGDVEDLAHELFQHARERAVATAIADEGVARAERVAASTGPVGSTTSRLPPPRARTRWGWRRSVRFAVERGMARPAYLPLYRRFVVQRLRHPQVVFEGMAFIGRRVELEATPHRGRLVIGPWCWIGDGAMLRAHEGNLRLGPKVVMGRQNVVNAYLDVEIGEHALLGDWIYVCDFDHAHDRLDVPIKRQGLLKTPTRVGADVWIGEKASVLRGADIGAGSVIGSQSLVRGAIPPFSVAVGSPARVVRSRLPAGMTVEEALALQRADAPIPGDPLEGPP